MYSAAVVDFDGTLYRGSRLLDGADRLLEALDEDGFDAVFFSNNPTKAIDDYPDRLPGRVVTSAVVAADYVAREHPGDRVYVVGEDALVEELRRRGVELVDDPGSAAVVLASIDRGFSYSDIRDAMTALDSADCFYATDPDPVIPAEEGLVPGTGAVVASLEAVGGWSPTYLGKPSEAAAEAALESVEAAAEEVLVVGDRLTTDVALAERMDADAALVATGVDGGSEAADADLEPNYVLDSAADAVDLLDV